MRTELINKIKEIVFDNNFLDTYIGEKFKQWNDIGNISAIMSFSGRSNKQECYRIPVSSDSDSDTAYLSHIYVTTSGEVKLQLSSTDTDDINEMLHPSEVPIESFSDELGEEWIELLTW